MNRARIEEIKKHFRLFAPKNIHKELTEVFKYIQALEEKLDALEKQLQVSLFEK